MPASAPESGIASPFVGRERELGTLQARLAEARRGRGGLVLVSGELGIGKTRLTERLAGIAAEHGMLVLAGRTWDGGGAHAYWPWVQVMRSWAATTMGADEADPATARLLRLVREAADGAGGTARWPDDPEEVPFAVFDGLAMALRGTARACPLVVLLEDLHVPDLASLRLLRLLVRELCDEAVLFVATYRTSEVRRAPRVADALTRLATEATHLPLEGLSEGEVALLVRERIRSRVPEALVGELYRATGGNPCFLDAVSSVLAAGWSSDPPQDSLEGVRLPQRALAIARRRLDSLDARCRGLLSDASILGNEFSAALLARVRGLDLATTLELLREAGDDGVVRAVPGALGRHRFTHGILRDALQADMGPARRSELHRRVGEALEAPDPTPHLEALAHHFTMALPAGDRRRALDHLERAGRQAVARRAYEDAISHFERALGLLTPGAEVAHRRATLLVARGEAQRMAGDAAAARASLLAGGALARRVGDAALLARAALGFGPEVRAGRVDDEQVALLEQALGAMPSGDGATRACVLAHLARALCWSDCTERRDACGAEAIAMARRLGDPATLAVALGCQRHLLWAPSARRDERLAVASEMLELAERVHDRELAADARQWRALDFLERGDRAAAERELVDHARLAGELAQPLYLAFAAQAGAALALLDGRFADAERLAHEADALARGPQRDDAERELYAQLFVLLREQGRLAPVLEGCHDRARTDPCFARHHPVLHCGLALVLADLDDAAAAGRALRRVAGDGFATLGRGQTYLGALCTLAEACALLRHTGHAAELFALLHPYRGRTVVLGRVLACLGPVSRFLGLLAATMQRWDEAASCFEEALDVADRLASPPLRARIQYDRAWMLVRREAGALGSEARRLLAEALAAARALGMARLASRAEQLMQGRKTPETSGGASSETRSVAGRRQGALRREGEYWVLDVRGKVLRLEESRGLRYLAPLLAEPGRERHALELTSFDGGTAPARHAMVGDAGPLLDGPAKAAYRRQLNELRAELEEATAANDRGRAERLRRDLEFLTAELIRAVGLGGRDRPAASPAERARLNVTRALRRVVARVAAAHPDLGTHLQRHVRTGFFCVYLPDARDPIHWTVEV